MCQAVEGADAEGLVQRQKVIRPGMAKKFDTIVIGLGAMGSAALYQLAKKGSKALGLDQYSPPHVYGSTHGETRVTRLAIGEGSHYTPLVQRSHELWREIERETGAAIGLTAFREAERLSFDLCLLGACAVSVSLGIGAFQMGDAEFKRTLIARSDRTAALVTMDKVETRAPFQVAALAVLDHVVLEAGTSEEIVSTFSNAGPEVIVGHP